MTLAVVVIAAGRREHLARTLDGLEHQIRRPDEIVVVDMRPGDPGRSVADVISPPARWLPLDVGGRAGDDGGPLPLARARNAGAAATDADRLVFLDVDCLPAPDLVVRYDDVLAAHPDALACGPVRYLRPDWLDGLASDRPRAALDSRSEVAAARPDGPAGSVRLGDDHELFWSLSFGATQATWRAVGGFDEGYRGYGGEDTDLGFRARSLGVRLAWFGGGTAYHQWHPPTRLDEARAAEIVANAQRFHRRWGTWPMTGWLRELHGRGRVVFDPDSDLLHLVGSER